MIAGPSASPGSPVGPLPVLLVTGFLGSGKTTLIRRLLAGPAGANAAVVVNELGEAGIDHHLLRVTEERTVLLAGGCACCGMRDDLVAALRDLVAMNDRTAGPRIDRIVVETTGLADPAPILHALVADPLLRQRVRRGRVVATLDAAAGARNLACYDEAIRQVAAADVVVLTKGDLAPADAPARLRDAVAALNPAALVVEADRGRVDPALLLADALPSRASGGAAIGMSPEPPRPIPMLHETGTVASRTVVFDAPPDWRMLGVWLTLLLHRHGERVLRLKGLLHTGAPGPLLVEGVQHVVHAPRHLPAWPDADRRSRLVFILRGLDPAAVEDSLRTFLAAGAPAASRIG